MPTDDEGNWQPDEPHYYVIRGNPARIEGYEFPGLSSLVWPRPDGVVWWHLQVWQPSAAVVNYLNRRGWKAHEPHAK
jgi:hypothetical protein